MSTHAQDIRSDATAVANKNALCIGCHCVQGYHIGFPEVHKLPNISGQHADYLYVALRSLKTTDKPLIGCGRPVMGGIAKQFSNTDMKVLANYIASLPGELQTVQRGRIQ